MHRIISVMAVIAAALALAAGAGAQINEEHVAAPPIHAQAWINSPPLTAQALRAKVALVAFWNYTTPACLRMLPYLRLWHRLYAAAGLVVIGVHTPEFSFAAEPDAVVAAAKRLELRFPIVLDGGRTVWSAFHNEQGPCMYLIGQGRLEYSECGGGDYAGFERLIQQMLKQANPKLDFSSARFTPHADPLPPADCKEPTADTYLGYSRADRLANRDGYQQLTPAWYRPEATLEMDQFDLAGHWLASPEDLQGRAPAAGNWDVLRLRYQARSVYLVAGAESGRVVPVGVLQDGRALDSSARGPDLQPGADGRTYLRLGENRLYDVIDNPQFGPHVLTLEVAGTGALFYAFVFDGNCAAALGQR